MNGGWSGRSSGASSVQQHDTRTVVDDAWRSAAAAADASGVMIRTVETAADSHVVARVLAEIWPQPNGASQVEANLVRALAYAGNYISIAWTADGSSAVGACVAFFAPPAERHIHSHIAGVTSAYTGRGIGRAMKLHQRAWSLERDVVDMSWTFDPLIARNAHFNLVRLGAVVTDYLPDFYGVMADQRNSGQMSDRFVVTWPLMQPNVARTAAEPHPRARSTSPGFEVVRVVDGRPTLAPGLDSARERQGRAVLRIPDDYDELRVRDPERAAEWRAVVNDALRATIGATTWRITAFDRKAGYVMEAVR